MNTAMTLHLSSASLEETEKLASQIGSRLRGGEVLALSSDLGGGKTAFVRGLARGMGSTDHVASPTFTISREYKAPSKHLTLYHFDFYRLAEPGIMANELAEIIDDPHAVVAVEWGDIVEGVLPDKKVVVQIKRTGEDSREFTFHYPDVLNYLFT